MDAEIRNKKTINTLAINIEIWRTINLLSKRKLGTISLLAESTIRNLELGTKNVQLQSLVKLRMGFNVPLRTLLEEYRLKQFKLLGNDPFG